MKRKILTAGLAVLTAVGLSTTTAMAQQKNKSRDNKKIILKSDGKDDLIIEVDDNKIKLNGETITGFKGDTLYFKDKAVSISKKMEAMSEKMADWGSSLTKALEFNFDADNLSFTTPPVPPTPPTFSIAPIPPIPPITFGDEFIFEPGDFTEITGNKSATLGVFTQETEKGARVVKMVNGSPTAAVLKTGDIITHVNKEKIGNPTELSAIINSKKPGDEVAIKFIRDGKKRKADIILSEQPSGNMHFNFNSNRNRNTNRATVRTIPAIPALRKTQLGVQIQDREDGRGVTVLNVSNGLAGEKAGIQKNDIITAIDGKPVNSITEAKSVIDGQQNKTTYKVKLLRNGEEIQVEVKQASQLKATDL